MTSTPESQDLDRPGGAPPVPADEALIARALAAEAGSAEREEALAVLYRRYVPKVSAWCLRLSGNPQEAADLAQEVFLRVHERLEQFRGASRFSTWLYTVTRSVVINRGVAARRRETEALDEEGTPEPVEPAPDAEELTSRAEIARAFRQALGRDLEPLEARVLYLHHVDGLPLAAITSLLRLENKSGAKAYVVSGGRKLKRRFGRWLERQAGGGVAP